MVSWTFRVDVSMLVGFPSVVIRGHLARNLGANAAYRDTGRKLAKKRLNRTKGTDDNYRRGVSGFHAFSGQRLN